MALKLTRMLALTAAPLTLTVVACSSDGSDPSALTSPSPNPVATTQAPTPSDSACAAVSADAAAKPPSAVPTPTDATFYEKLKSGSTTDYFAYADGDDVKVRRGPSQTQLRGAGVEDKGTGAAGNQEGEAQVAGQGIQEG